LKARAVAAVSEFDPRVKFAHLSLDVLEGWGGCKGAAHPMSDYLLRWRQYPGRRWSRNGDNKPIVFEVSINDLEGKTWDEVFAPLSERGDPG